MFKENQVMRLRSKKKFAQTGSGGILAAYHPAKTTSENACEHHPHALSQMVFFRQQQGPYSDKTASIQQKSHNTKPLGGIHFADSN
ncbi:hypothetical protein [Synechococcus sp. BIOS-E4-1]|uniref:hypothetical protein n=1 Tax=Synechococcus sp. BIOS-E4-1 TaxID=1400864 RepID=UPI001644D6D1|nr:hypothetical protein [Synechococcus sp. BIOS-E4-1]